MSNKKKVLILLGIFLFIIVSSFIIYNLKDYIKYELYSKNDLNLCLNLVNSQVKLVSAEPSNRVALRIQVRDTSGNPVSKAPIELTTDKELGNFSQSYIRTDRDGQALVDYIPPELHGKDFTAANLNLSITSRIKRTEVKSTTSFKLTRIPIVYVHGYQAYGSNFDILDKYLESKGYKGTAINYKSSLGVASGAKELKTYIENEKKLYMAKGLQVGKFNIIAHSMGGLVARYYSSNTDYAAKSDIIKMIFLSVPHRGSPWASLGESYYKDEGIKDLIPDNQLFSVKFPGMINKGLNNKIQIGNIIVEYDEVVSPESGSLEEWGIGTDVFNVGESSFTMDNILTGNIIEAANHKKVLSNKKVFERILQMLETSLPYPSVKK